MENFINNIHEKAKEIEYSLTVQFVPTFISYAVMEEDNYIHLIIATNKFKNKERKEMIRLVYDCILVNNRSIMEEIKVYIETYTNDEFALLLDNCL